MSDIPQEIEKAAREVCRNVEAMPSAGNAFIVADEIWRRVLAERERCRLISIGLAHIHKPHLISVAIEHPEKFEMMMAFYDESG